MTSIRDLLAESVGVGETVRLELDVPTDAPDDRLVADHPADTSPMDVAVVYGLDRLDERPPAEPVAVEIVGEVLDGRIAGRVVASENGD